MGTSSITLTSLTATPSLRGNKLSAVVLAVGPAANIPSLMLDTVEFYASTTNDFTTAAKVVEGNPEALHAGLVEEQTYYYWARARAVNDSVGAVYPTSPTGGVACAAAGRATLVNGRIDASVSGGLLTFTIKTLDGQTPSASNPVFVTFNAVPNPSPHTKATVTIESAVSFTTLASQTFGIAGDSVPFRLWLAGVLKDGIFYLGVMNCLLRQTSVVNKVMLQPIPDGYVYGNSLVAGNAFAPTNNVFGTLYIENGGAGAVNDCQVRVLGYAEWPNGLAVNGTWDALPDFVQLHNPGMPKPGDVVNQLVRYVPDGASSFNVGGTGGAAKLLPLDDTVPEYDEGYNVTDVAVNVQSACNVMETEFELPVSGSNLALMIGAVNGPATAITYGSTGEMTKVTEYAVSGLAGHARQFRIGSSTVGSVDYGRLSGSRAFGGVWLGSIRVRELMG